MDGNGRWARAHGRPRAFGHARGVESIRDITTECSLLEGIGCLTLYALSRENYSRRPAKEVNFLMGLLRTYLRREAATFREHNIRVRFIGEWEVFPKAVREQMLRSLAETEANRSLVLTFALNYGGRAEVVAAVRRLLVDLGRGILKEEEVDEAAIAARLDTAGMPDPDLIIRTAGEMRLSNFLLWQASYAEFWSTELCWPDFRKEQLWEALENYQRRVRKFGALRRGLDPAKPPGKEPPP
jgi:undecaprenyl diphosphate synthase